MKENAASKANYTVEFKMMHSIDETLILGKPVKTNSKIKQQHQTFFSSIFNVRFKKQNLKTK